MPVTDDYARFVNRIWDGIHAQTGHQPFYIDASSIASYCPSCLDGTLTIRFLQSPRPGMAVSSLERGPGTCSSGCTERQIIEALAGPREAAP